MTAGSWPALKLPWADTRDTLHMWTQIVGKVKLALNPMVNHWWQVPLYVSARGLTTGLMVADGVGIELEFDFVSEKLSFRTSNGDERAVVLQPRSVADFYAATMATLADLSVAVTINTRPTEVEVAIPFDQDEQHASYDADAVRAFWRALVAIERVLFKFRGRFLGKHSPVHFFWGGFDLASTRFSGRPAPQHGGGVPNCPDFVQVLAYSHEVSSVGYWPGGDGEGAFYSYAYPTPEGFAKWAVEPASAFYDETLGEFLLPYEAVRAADDPDAMLLAFCQTAYDAAANLANWDPALTPPGA